MVMDLDKAIQNRKSVRKFSSKKPDWRDIMECIDSMRFSPTAGKNFTLKIILVDDEKKIKKISKEAQQEFISDVSYLVAVCSDSSRLKNSFGERGKIYSKQQAGSSIQNFLLKIEEKGLATCWVGHFVEDQIKRELKIPKKLEVEAVFPVGYSLNEEKPKRKISFDNIIYFNKHGNKNMKK